MINVPTFYELINNFCSVNNREMVNDAIDLMEAECVLQDYEKEFIKTFKEVIKTTGSVPTRETIKQHIPTYRCDSSLELDDILGSTRLFIKSRLNKRMSNRLLALSEKVAKEGINEEVALELGQMTMSDVVTKTFTKVQDEISSIYKKDIDRSGIKTGTRKIDDIIGGLKPGQISTVAGYTSAGKSTFSLSLMHEAIKRGFNVCYLSLELPREHVMYNLISRHSVDTFDDGRNRFTTKIEHSRLKSKTATAAEWKYCEDEIIPSLNKLPGKYYIVGSENLEARTFFAYNNTLQEIENLCIEESGKGLDLIIVDYIQMMKYTEEMKSRVSEFEVTNMWVNYWRNQALDFLKSKRQVHVLMAAQINRTGWLKAAKRDGEYDLTALAESNEIEKASSVIISLFSSEQLKESKEVKFQILKNRDGIKKERADTIYCDFAYQVIGGDSSTSDNDFASASFEDFGAISESPIDVSSAATNMEMLDEQFDF